MATRHLISPQKRLFDIGLGLIGAIAFCVPILAISIWILVKSGRPILYRAERMRGIDDSFALLKFRTMTVDSSDSGVSGADKEARITPEGRILRRLRLDELPQIWNILKGDISCVGPRPPLREYVERFPAVYAEVLRHRPGVTGVASLFFHHHEEWILAQCHTREETDHAYVTRCIPRKARLDALYARNANVCLDARLVGLTLLGVVRRRKRT